jgi:hypothetical protein
MGRPKKAGRELESIEECTAAMGDLLIAATQLDALTADRDLAVAKASKVYEAPMDLAREQKAGLEAALKGYYYAHLAELEKDGVKHFQLANGVMGRRDNPARLALKNRAWTWGAVLVLLRAEFGDRFLRVQAPEIDKGLVRTELPKDDLAEYGLKLEKDETFYAEPARLPEVKG